MELNKSIARGLATFIVKYEQFRHESVRTDKLNELYKHKGIFNYIIDSFDSKLEVHLEYNYKNSGCIDIKDEFNTYTFVFINYKLR